MRIEPFFGSRVFIEYPEGTQVVYVCATPDSLEQLKFAIKEQKLGARGAVDKVQGVVDKVQMIKFVRNFLTCDLKFAKYFVEESMK